jgi:5-methylcytosine-specific restriction protein A
MEKVIEDGPLQNQYLMFIECEPVKIEGRKIKPVVEVTTMPKKPMSADQYDRMLGRKPPKPKRERPTANQRGYNYKWQQIRKAFLASHPDCALCGRPAKHVHHITALRDGGNNEWDNLISLCASCHSQVEAKGRG